jgi:hypothetical protein
LDELGCSPLELMAQIAMNDTNALGMNENVSVALRLKAASELAGFLYPRRRAVEATVESNDSLLAVLQQLAESSAQSEPISTHDAP